MSTDRPLDTYDCVGDVTPTPIPTHYVCCDPCWRRLPGRFRLAIDGTYWGGRGLDSPRHELAVTRAMDWLRSNLSSRRP